MSRKKLKEAVEQLDEAARDSAVTYEEYVVATMAYAEAAGDEIVLRYVGDGTVLVLEGRQVPPRDLTAEEAKYYNVDFLLTARYAGRALYERVEVNDDGDK